MNVSHDSLAKQLTDNAPLKPYYLITGSEPLLAEEARSAIHKAATQQGYEEYLREQIPTNPSWETLLTDYATPSLFSQRCILELRLASLKLGKAGHQGLQSLLETVDPSYLLILICPKLDASTQRSPWLQTIKQQGMIVNVNPIPLQQMPTWLQKRLHNFGFKVDIEVCQFLALLAESNLQAAQQEIEKLSLLYEAGPLSMSQVKRAVSDHARYQVFDLVDACLAGNPKRCQRLLSTLQQEGLQPPLILWALTRELRILCNVMHSIEQGQSMATALQSSKVWSSRKALIQQSAQRYSQQQWLQLLAFSAHIDEKVKGVRHGDVWLSLQRLCVAIAGFGLAQIEENINL